MPLKSRFREKSVWQPTYIRHSAKPLSYLPEPIIANYGSDSWWYTRQEVEQCFVTTYFTDKYPTRTELPVSTKKKYIFSNIIAVNSVLNLTPDKLKKKLRFL